MINNTISVAIIGSRKFSNYKLLKIRVSELVGNRFISNIVSGGALGADKLAERYANEFDIPMKIFLPDWEKYGKSAGFIRNSEIISNADVVIAFWNSFSKGTLDSITKAKKLGKEMHIIEYTKELLADEKEQVKQSLGKYIEKKYKQLKD